jgi:hypothetical protein
MTYAKIEQEEVQKIISNLRKTLSRNDMAFGALFIKKTNGHSMLLMAEDMHIDLRRDMLVDLKDLIIDLLEESVQ